MQILDQNNDPTPVKSDGCKRMEEEIPAWFKPYKIVLRPNIGKGAKPQIAALDGQIRYFSHGWTIEDDHRLYPGEKAMLPYINLNNITEWPLEIGWVASGDLQPVEDIVHANTIAAASTIKERLVDRRQEVDFGAAYIQIEDGSPIFKNRRKGPNRAVVSQAERDIILANPPLYYDKTGIIAQVSNHYGQTLHANNSEEKLESIMRIISYSHCDEKLRELILGVLES